MHVPEDRRLITTFSETYERHSDAILRFCRNRTRSTEEAEDIMQEAFMRTWEYLRTGNTIEDVKAFLFRVAENLIIDAHRTQKNNVSFEDLYEKGFDPGLEEMDLTRTKMDVQSMLMSVEKKQEYKLLVMRYVHGLRPKDIAMATGIPANTVAVRLHRALKRLTRKYFPEKKVSKQATASR